MLRRASLAASSEARPGDLLYPGDQLVGGRATVVDCRATPDWGPAVRVERPAVCLLPPVPREGVSAPLTATRESPEPLAVAWQSTSPVGRLVEAEQVARRQAPEGIAWYQALAAAHPEFRELSSQRILLLEEMPRRAAAPVGETLPGRTLALLIGISEFENAQVRPLRFAHEDAYAFERFLRSPRGGRLGDDEIVVLTNRQATTAAVRAALESLARRATPRDTVLILLATHGAVVESARNQPRGAFLVTYDSDPENLAATALPMAVLQRTLRVDLASAGRVLAFVDACRSGTIGTIPDRSKLKILSVMDGFTETEGRLLLLTASRPGEVSYEGRQYGGGHGAFTFFTLEGLNGAADTDSDGKVTASEMITYVQQRVAEATADKQHPREGGTLDTTLAIADLSLPGIDLGLFRKDGVEAGVRSVSGSRPVRVVTLREAVDFEQALEQRRLLPDEPANVFTAFRQMKQSRRWSRAELDAAGARLLVALEQQQQQVLLAYLKGDRHPPRREDFARASRMVQAAMQLFGETPSRLSRQLFFEGRLAILDRRFAEAVRHLEAGLRLEPNAAHLWNALGSARLELGDVSRAVAAFETAVDQAPNWIYPRNSLALAQMAAGQFSEGEKTFRAALALMPDASYLRVNLGSLYQRVGRLPEAEEMYRAATVIPEPLAEAWNALGTLRIAQRRYADAEDCFRRALVLEDRLAEARENLARLVAMQPGRQQEALRLRKENREKVPSFLPSRVALAESMPDRDREAEWQSIVDTWPELGSARMALARSLFDGGNISAAARQVAALTAEDPSLPLLELRGDLAQAQGDAASAARYFSEAATLAWDREDRKRLQGKRRMMSRTSARVAQ